MEIWKKTLLKDKLLQRYGSTLREIDVSESKVLALVDSENVPPAEFEFQGWSITTRRLEWCAHIEDYA